MLGLSADRSGDPLGRSRRMHKVVQASRQRCGTRKRQDISCTFVNFYTSWEGTLPLYLFVSGRSYIYYHDTVIRKLLFSPRNRGTPGPAATIHALQTFTTCII